MMNYFKNIFLIFFSIFSTLICQTTFYVSPNGSDSNDGSFSQPFKTINYGLGLLDAGDILEIFSGIYYEILTNFSTSGTLNQPIIIKNHDQDKVVIDANGGWTVISLNNKKYYYFQGLELKNAVWSGFNGAGYHFCKISNCIVHDIGPSSGTSVGIFISTVPGNNDSSTYNLIENSTVYNIYGEGIYIGNDAKSFPPDGTHCNHNIIRNNTIYNCIEGIELKTGSKYNHIVQNKIFEGNGGVFSAGIIVFEETIIDSNQIYDNSNYGIFILGNKNRILRNIIYHNQSCGIYINGYESIWNNYKDSGDDNLLLNNTIVYNGDVGLYINGLENQDCRNSIIQNNIISENTNNQLYISFYAKEGLRLNSNDFLSNNGPLIHYSGTDFFDIESFTRVTGIVSNSMSIDPHFSNSENHDFHLNKSSPIIDKGTPSDLSFWGSAPDIGAYEYIPVYYPNNPTISSVDSSLYATASLIRSSLKFDKSFSVLLVVSRNVIRVPTPMFLKENDGTNLRIDMSGTVPGKQFFGSFSIDDSIADGLAFFELSTSSLVDSSGNIGNTIVKGDSIFIDKIAPSSPTHLQFK